MNALQYSTMDYREELDRVRRARRRNTALIVIADLGIAAGAIYFVLTHFVF